MKYQYKLLIMCGMSFAFVQSSCRKFVEVDAPVTSINSKNVYNTDVTAAAVLTGLYSNFDQDGFSISIVSALAADELTLFGGSSSQATDFVPFYLNRVTSTDLGIADFCKTFYPKIYVVNSAIEGLTSSQYLSASVKQQLLGEAYFMRAFYYFYLVNLFGDVPLALTTDYSVNGLLSRTSKDKVYQQIISDLERAQRLLSAQFLKSDAFSAYSLGVEERVRPTKWAATALLARTYLYTGKWKNAEEQASAVINNSILFHLTPLNETFIKNNSEAIWQIQPVRSNLNTVDAATFILPDTGPGGSASKIYLNNKLVNEFEFGDQRKNQWINSVEIGELRYYYAYKYKIPANVPVVTEYSVVMRLAEQYLIRAEARTQQDNLEGANNDLNAIRTRAGLENVNINNKVNMLVSILHERRIELFTEWGHRWFDLKRTGNIDKVMSVASLEKGGIWDTNKQLYPFSASDLEKDPNLIQNPGYQ